LTMLRACTATRHRAALREMADAKWTMASMARALGVHPNTVKSSLKKLGIHHPGMRWTPRKYKTHPIIAKLREERMDKCMTVHELAKKVGYCGSLISEWERGSRRMHFQALVNVSEALGYEITLRRIGG
jgi:hypothetical protein